jgi:hypothetical protein
MEEDNEDEDYEQEDDDEEHVEMFSREAALGT